MRIERILLPQIPAAWELVREKAMKLLQKDWSYWSEEDAINLLLTGAWQFWLIETPFKIGFCVTEIFSYPRRKGIRLVMGEGEGLLGITDEVLRVIENYGREHGAEFVEIQGRYGWSKTLLDSGFVRRAVVMEKRIEA